MKVVILGLSVSSSWGNGHATLWRGLCTALAHNGHDIVFFERDVPYYAQRRDVFELPGFELILYQNWKDALPAARRHATEADVAIVTSYQPDALAATEVVLDSAARLRVFYDLDTPVTLDRLDAGLPVAECPHSRIHDTVACRYVKGKLSSSHLASARCWRVC